MRSDVHKKIDDFLKNVPCERVFLKLEDISYTYRDILSLCSDFKLKYSDLSEKNCAVISDDRESLAIYLPVLDSICNSVLLQPTDSINQTDWYDRAAVEYIVRVGNRKIVSVEKIEQPVVAKQSNKYNTSFILATSGTTGQPKLASYSLESLTAKSQKNIERGCDFIWGLTYDITRFAGLQVYLQAAVAGSTIVLPQNSDNTDAMVCSFINNSVNCLSATPSFWRKILMNSSHREMPLERITLGGEIVNQNILNALCKSFPSAKVIHIYASTEAGVGFSVKDKMEGFPAEYLLNGIDGTRLRAIDGSLWIKNSNRCTHFLKGNVEIDEHGYINTGDLIEVKKDRVFFLGRANGSINVGGNKVMPEKVEAILEECPIVSMAKVFAKKSSVLGDLVSADLVLTPEGESIPKKDLKSRVVTFCRDKLEPFEVPAIVKRVDFIETNSTGKKIRNGK
ncbi:AMP-dependent synthetase [Salinivibrio proteolyticus]|nr:AMP-dependent synthetase [Salinivibrio proteolyticus]